MGSIQLNDDYETLKAAGFEHIEGSIMPQPISRPKFTLTELRNAIPAHCFKRNMWKSLAYLGSDLVLASMLSYCTYIMLEEQFLPFYCRLVGYLIYWFLQGCVFFGLWVLGHECGHGAFFESETVNDLVGLIVHSAILVPYYSFKITHRKHHGNTGHCEDDVLYVPYTEKEVEPIWSETLENSSLYHVFKIFKVLFVGWPAYLAIHTWGSPKYRDKAESHFNPYAAFFLPKERTSIVLSDIFCVLAVVVICYFISVLGFPTVIRLYFVPYLIMTAVLITVAYLQHTDTYVPHMRNDEWSWLRGALCTVDRSYGKFVDIVGHHLTDTHVCHHLFPKIPFYHCAEATEAIKPILGKYYLRDTTPIYLALWRVINNCKYVQNDGQVVFYKSKLSQRSAKVN